MKKRLGKLMMLMGMLLLIAPISGSLYIRFQQALLYQQLENQMPHDETQVKKLNQTLAEGTNLGKRDEERVIGREGGLTSVEGITVLGTISIPKIDIEMLLLEGITQQELQYGAGHMLGTAMPGEVGNCAIAGHRNYTFGSFFNRLHEVEIGDVIEITYGQQSLRYEVYETFIVEPSELEVTSPQGEKAIVTLITCHPIVTGTHRLIVRGELVVA